MQRSLRWRKPRCVLVSDLFNDKTFTYEQIAAVFGVMAAAPRHTFQVLTKAPEHLRNWFLWLGEHGPIREDFICQRIAMSLLSYGCLPLHSVKGTIPARPWPLPNVWLGVCCEDQRSADERIPLLLTVPAAVSWVSLNPLLGPVNLDRWIGFSECDPRWCKHSFLRWVVVSGESGRSARPCQVEWIRSIVHQCNTGHVACFIKQLGAHYVDAANGVGGVQARPDYTVVPPIRRLRHRSGADMSEWPE